jgi:putative spermidine/putrescine transport system permease protein
VVQRVADPLHHVRPFAMTAAIESKQTLRRRISRFLSARPRVRLGSLLTVPALWLVVLYLGSLIALFVTSFYSLNEDGTRIVEEFGLSNYKDLLTVQVYRDITFRTLGIAALVTVIDIVLALPISFFIAKLASPRSRTILITLVLVPLWGSYLVKTFAWRALLGSPGGVIDETFGFSPGYGQVAVVIVLAYLWLPYMIVPIYAGLDRLPDSLLEASNDLGAGFFMTFRSVVIPMLFPAIVAGSVFTFSLSMGDYIAVELVGGPTQMIGSVVYDNFATNLPFAAAFAVVPVVVMIVYLLGIRRTGALDNL